MEKIKIICKNKNAYHDYFILDELECGICLVGTEIKSIRLGKVSLQDTYCEVKKGELFICGMHISTYTYGNIFNHEEKRERKLLAHASEIRKLEQKVKLDGLTIIPLMAYFNQGLLKIKVALCRGKKKFDKREEYKKETIKREINKRKW